MNDKQATRELQIYTQLNKQFYRDFDAEYFEQKITYLLILLSDIDDLDKKIQAGVKWGKIKMSGDFTGQEKEKLRKNLEAEIALTYHHAIETLFRLLVSHAKWTFCPWVELTGLRFYEFKKFIDEEIKQQGLTIEGRSYQKSITLLLFGADLSSIKNKITKEKWERNLRQTKEFLDYFAGNVLQTPHYNSYKHGLAVFQNALGINFGDSIQADKQDSFTFIEFKKNQKEEFLSKTHHFIKWEERFTLTIIATRMIKNIISVGRTRLLEEMTSVRIELFDEYDLYKIIDPDDKGVVVDSVSMSL